jgi:hypothetical protein
MQQEILTHIGNPAELERVYRANKSAFKRAFTTLYPQLQDNSLAAFWNARLNYVREEIAWGSRRELIFVLGLALLAGLLAKLPAIFHINDAFFYTRNAGFIIFPMLAIYFGWKNQLSTINALVVTGLALTGLVFMNLFPDNPASDTLTLSCIHMCIFLWALLGFVFSGAGRNTLEKRLGYLSYNGDLVVMSTLLLIAGGILSAVTNGLFLLIGINIEKFYFQNVVIFGLPFVPIVGTYLTQTNPQLVGKVSPVIAKIFSPLVLVMLVIYLAAVVYTGKDPYNDRGFLLIFNALLVGVMAIIFFSVAESSRTRASRGEIWVLVLLSLVTIVVNGIALSAILFRISEWGMTPNRAAVLGSNGLMLVNLLWVALRLAGVISGKKNISTVGNAIAVFLPVYGVWAAIVSFVFPFVFGFK